jgi:hypothetical protein
MAKFSTRVAAATPTIKPAQVLLLVLAAPFVLLGWVAGLLWKVTLLAVGAVRVGFADAMALGTTKPTPELVPGDDVEVLT